MASTMLSWQEFTTVHWVITGIIGFYSAVTALWIVFKIIWGRRVAPWWSFIGYSGFLLIFWPFSEISRDPRWRRKWLQRASVKEGDVVLDEGFDMGTSAIAAARLVGPGGKVYALDNEPVHVAILWLRAKIRRLKNLNDRSFGTLNNLSKCDIMDFC